MPLWLPTDPIGDDVEDAIGHLGRPVAEPGPKRAVDVRLIVHAVRPPTVVTRASASSAARMAR